MTHPCIAILWRETYAEDCASSLPSLLTGSEFLDIGRFWRYVGAARRIVSFEGGVGGVFEPTGSTLWSTGGLVEAHFVMADEVVMKLVAIETVELSGIGRYRLLAWLLADASPSGISRSSTLQRPLLPSLSAPWPFLANPPCISPPPASSLHLVVPQTCLLTAPDVPTAGT